MSKNLTDIFYTVPLSAEKLVRLPDGTKSNPGFPDDWLQYTTKRNTKATPLLGAIAKEDFIGIDIDITELFNEIIGLDEGCEYIAKSDIKGGHLLYAYNESDATLLKQIIPHAKKAKIDVQMGNKLIYLATPANKTKTLLTEPLQELPQRRIPTVVLNTLLAHAYKVLLASPEHRLATDSKYDTTMLDNSTLGYLLEQEFTPEIVAKVVPSKLLIKHPQDLKQGEGTEWFNQVRFRLAQDPSVSEEKFKALMLYINTLWDDPMPNDRILSDCAYDIKTRQNSVTGDTLWRYNPNWKQEGFTYPNRFGDTIEIMYDSQKAVFIEYNNRTRDVHIFNKQTDIISSLVSNSKARKKMNGEAILKKADSVNLVNTPEENSGKLVCKTTKPRFNMFMPSEGTQIMKSITKIREPQHPENTLKFFENLIPDEENRYRLFQFLAHKHTTYEHSELYFVLAGVGGAGKGIFTELYLTYFAGADRVQEVNLEKLQNNFNAWMATTDYAIIDEGGEGESKTAQAKLVGELKKRTGRSTVAIEAKGKDIAGSVRHYITPVITTNMNTKLITDTATNDRRLVLFRCPNKLIKITDDTREFISLLKAELPHFAVYIKNLPKIDYQDYRDNRRWKNADYYDYIESTTAPIDKLVEAIEENNLERVLEVFTEDLSLHPQDIDSMFGASVSGEGNARLLLYNTTATRSLGLKSLVDIADTINPALNPVEVKTKLKKAKKKVTYRPNSTSYNIQVIEFNAKYKPMSGIEVDVIEGDVEL